MKEFEDLEYDLELDLLIETIIEKKFKIILLQFPEGIMAHATEIKDTLEEKTQAEFLISGNSCYGACDIPAHNEVKGIDLIVQFGHAGMPNIKSPTPIMHIEARSRIDVISVVKKAMTNLSKKVGIITTVQHIHKLSEVEEFLSEYDFEVHVGKGTGRIAHKGQVLGCNLSSALSISEEVDCYLFLGSGNFHAIGVALSTKKPVYVADPYIDEVRGIDEIRDRLLRQRYGAIIKAKDAVSFGLIVSTKPGQTRLNYAFKLKKLAESHNKKVYIFLLNEVVPEKLSGFSVDALVNCACPRIAIDDFLRYPRPILNPFEFKIVLGDQKWDDYYFDSLL